MLDKNLQRELKPLLSVVDLQKIRFLVILNVARIQEDRHDGGKIPVGNFVVGDNTERI
jgi:hypothetical protein